MHIAQFKLKVEFPISFKPWVADREKILQIAEIRLANVPHRERSIFIKQLFWLTWAKAIGSAPHLQSSFLELIWML
jgi:hypothetical protein